MEDTAGKNKSLSLLGFNKIGVISFVILVCSGLVTIGVAIKPLMLIGFCVAVGAIILVEEEWQITAFLIALLNIANIFKLAPGSSSLFTYLELIAVLKFLSFDYQFNTKFIQAWLVYAAYVFLGCSFNILPFLKVVFVPLLLYFMTRKLSYRQLLYISCFYILGVVISSLIALTKDIIPNMNLYVIHEEAFLGEKRGIVADARFSGLWSDPNYYSVHLLLSISISIIMVIKKEINPLMFVLICLFMIVLGGRTGSKSFFFTISALCVVFVIMLFNHKQFFLGSIILCMGIILIYLIQSGTIGIFNTALVRIQTNMAGEKNDLTTGRSSLWLLYVNEILNNPLLAVFGNGVGKGNFFRLGPHNTYIDFIEFIGIAGTSLFIYTVSQISYPIVVIDQKKKENKSNQNRQGKYIKSWNDINRNSRLSHSLESDRDYIKKEGLSVIEHRALCCIPLLTLCALYFFLSMFSSEDFVFELFLAFSFIKLHENDGQTVDTSNRNMPSSYIRS